MGTTAESEAQGVRRIGRPRLSEARQLEEQILLAARQTFIERGFKGTSMEQVALAAGTTRQSVLHRFADRDILLVAVAMQKAEANVRQVLIADSLRQKPLARLKRISRNLLSGATESEMVALMRVQLGETGRLPDLSDCLARYNIEFESRVEQIVLLAQAQGDFKDHGAAAIATVIAGVMLSHPIKRAMIGDELFRDPGKIARYFDHMWATILSMA